MKITKQIIEKFNSYVEFIPFTTCWISTLKPTDDRGYTQIRIGKKKYHMHRLSFEIHKGKIPKGMLILHTCDTPACCNPEHLWYGTQSDNMKDCYAKGRSAALKNLPN